MPQPKQSGQIGVGVGLALARENRLVLRFSVTDTKERMGELVTPFHQDTSPSWYGGLGLATCRKRIELMGGCLGVDSCEGLGSTFWFEIACKIAAIPAEAATH